MFPGNHEAVFQVELHSQDKITVYSACLNLSIKEDINLGLIIISSS